ncbi:hypothetical protein [Massilia oculi]|uniref:hypothetical protein n=1 Tax=Massilia oculi TaxID=945844 RepID=UPI0028AA9517|nr:hypothetical protein [Massilia oculi]
MSVGISNVAHALRDYAASTSSPISLSHCQQLVAAALGYKSLASYQAAEKQGAEVTDLAEVSHVLIDRALLSIRAKDLNVGIPPWMLEPMVIQAFEQRLPAAQIHDSTDSLEGKLSDIVSAQVMENDNVSGLMAMTNSNGPRDMHVEFEFNPSNRTLTDSIEIPVRVQVVMNIDEDRTYSDHRIAVSCITNLECLGQACFGQVSVEVSQAKMDFPGEKDYDFGPPRLTKSEVYSELLGIHVDDLGALADVEPEELTGHSGDMTYGYLLDFEESATPEQAEMIRRRHGSLTIEVPPLFFEDIVHDDWPN